MLWLSMFTSSMTLTLDFQGKILKESYLSNGMADWHGTKGTWVDRMLDSHCDFKLWPHPWPWPWMALRYGLHQGWGQVLLEVLESSTSTFKICKFKYKYKYSQYLDGIKYIKYFFNQVQVPSTLVTNNSIVSLWVQNSFTTITLVHTVTYKVKNTFQICTKITFILWNQPWIDKLCICHPTQLMAHVINHRRSWLLVIASTKILQT